MLIRLAFAAFPAGAVRIGLKAVHPLREQVLDASQRTANPPPLRVPLITKALIGKAEHDGQKQQRQHQQKDRQVDQK